MSSEGVGRRKAIVTGGGGFLGRAIIGKLLEEGYEVANYSRGDYPDLRKMGVKIIRGDLGNLEETKKGFEGFDVVFHVAAKVGYWGNKEDYRKVNVDGTKNVIEACERNGIKDLVFTSSPSVIFDGKDMEGVDESVPYPKEYDSPYSETKAEAERLVMAANSKELRTISLRPHLIWGPGDSHLIPEIIARAKNGKITRIGKGRNVADMVYVDNAADAHIMADKALRDNPDCRGKAFFISNDDPQNVWGFINRLVTLVGAPPIKRSVPTGLAFVGAVFTELFYKIFRKGKDPPLSRFLVRELSTSHWYDISAAKKELGFVPKVSIDEGLKRLKVWIDEELG